PAAAAAARRPAESSSGDEEAADGDVDLGPEAPAGESATDSAADPTSDSAQQTEDSGVSERLESIPGDDDPAEVPADRDEGVDVAGEEEEGDGVVDASDVREDVAEDVAAEETPAEMA